MSTSLLKSTDIGRSVPSKSSEAFAGGGWGLVVLLLMFIAVAMLFIVASG